jgi:Periplasmic protein involved in polysaccharide export
LSGCAAAPTKNEESAPVASSEQYILGSEDVIEISVWKEEDLSKVVLIRPDGKISLPLIGDIQAAGLTAEELKESIKKSLINYVDSPTVSVIVQQINSLKIFIQGEVARPGVLELRSNTTLLQAISLAGGFTEWAKKDKVGVLRRYGDKVVRIPVDYEKILSGEDLSQDILLKRGDTIVVP